VTIRLLDVGGDKPVPFLPLPVEPNPSLGRRGVRLLLEYPQLVRTQLAALFRLAQEQDIRILVPMVTLEEDIREMRVLFDATLETFPRTKRPPFGAMIETPAAALGVATIARHVDFLSVGTNDLAQYTLAAGRDDPAVSHYYDDTHATVMRLLAIAIADARGVPIALCGDRGSARAGVGPEARAGVRRLTAVVLDPASEIAHRRRDAAWSRVAVGVGEGGYPDRRMVLLLPGACGPTLALPEQRERNTQAD